MPVTLPNGQGLLTFEGIENGEFFKVLPMADTPNAERYRKFFVALPNTCLPPERRCRGEGNGYDYMLFYIARVDRRPGQSAIIWLQQTDEVNPDDFIVATGIGVFVPEGGDVCLLPGRGIEAKPSTVTEVAPSEPLSTEMGDPTPRMRTPHRHERARGGKSRRRKRLEESTHIDS